MLLPIAVVKLFVLCAVGVQEAVDDNEGTLSNIVGGIQASKDSSYNRCDEAESDCCAEVLAMPDSGRCSPVSCLCSPCKMRFSTL